MFYQRARKRNTNSTLCTDLLATGKCFSTFVGLVDFNSFDSLKGSKHINFKVYPLAPRCSQPTYLRKLFLSQSQSPRFYPIIVPHYCPSTILRSFLTDMCTKLFIDYGTISPEFCKISVSLPISSRTIKLKLVYL